MPSLLRKRRATAKDTKPRLLHYVPAGSRMICRSVGMSNKGLRREAGGPMYQQLRQDLLARIRRGEFEPGSVLPSENQLCEDYGVSVTTARRAFLELVKEGVVRRKAGVGTIVASGLRRAQINFLSIDYVGDSWRQYSSVMGEMIAGVSEHAWHNDATLSILGVKDEEAATYLRGLAEERATDGVLLRVVNDIREEHLDILEQAGIPYVVIKRRIPGRKMNYVNSDDVAGARMAAAHLLELGHRRIGFVCAKPYVTFSQERLAGYKAALEDHGLEVEGELIRTEPHFTQEMGYRAARSLLELPEPPTALFVASDTMAVGGYEAVQELGYRIPNDVSIVGYDDVALAAALMPPLTTVRTSFYEFGQLSSQLLLELINNRESAPSTRMIHPRLILRSSAAELDADYAPAPVDVGSEPGQIEKAQGERLAGEVLVYSGAGGEIDRAIIRACELEGGRVADGISEAEAYDSEASGAVIGLDLAEGLGHELGRALGQGRQLSQTLRGQADSLVIAALLRLGDTPAGDAERAAARAGLQRIVTELSGEQKGEAPRVNGLLIAQRISAPRVEPERIRGALGFLLSADGREIAGETMVLLGGKGTLTN